MGPLPDWQLTPEKAALHLPTRTAVVADLHLGYGLARQRRGEMVPQCRMEDVLLPLRVGLNREKIQRLVLAGDVLEDGRCEGVIEVLLEWLSKAEIELVGVVPGNHDRGLDRYRDRLPLFPEGLELASWHILHGDQPLVGQTLLSGKGSQIVQGHLHPCLRWGRITAPCYLANEDHLILPAFSLDAAGVNVLHDPRWQAYRCFAIAENKVMDFGEVKACRRLRLSAGR